MTKWAVGILFKQLFCQKYHEDNFRERTYTRQNFAFLSPRFLKKKASKQKCLLVFFCVNFSRLPAVCTFCSSIEKWLGFCKKCQLGSEKMSNRIEKSAYVNLVWSDPKLCIPSTLNIDLILWHTQLIVCVVKC